MLTKLVVFGAVALLTRSPLLAAGVTLAVWLVVDWNAFQLVPRLGRRLADLRRALFLRATLRQNAHDRRARAALADIYNRLGRPAAAVEAVKPAVEADPGDLEALYQLGVACLRLGDLRRGDLFLSEVEAAHPGFRQGEIHFEQGRARLRAGDAPGAAGAAERFLGAHPGSVRGLVLLAGVKDALGDAAAAAAARERAWEEFTELPRFAKREARRWAWQAKPARPLAYLGVAALVASVLIGVPRFL
ncbi:MAG: tetratricopeptide repeat protein [Myxococcales bacterium]